MSNLYSFVLDFWQVSNDVLDTKAMPMIQKV